MYLKTLEDGGRFVGLVDVEARGHEVLLDLAESDTC
jgi:hypothetical protein